MQGNKIVKILKIVPAGAYNGLIWFLSSIQLPVNIASCDKFAHLLEYSIMGFLLSFMFAVTRKNLNPTAQYCMFFGVFAGGMDEIHQYFVPGRTCDFFDFLTDITGIAAGIFTWLLVTKLLSYIKLNLFTKKV